MSLGRCSALCLPCANQMRQAGLRACRRVGVNHPLSTGPIQLFRSELQFGLRCGQIPGGDGRPDLANLRFNSRFRGPILCAAL